MNQDWLDRILTSVPVDRLAAIVVSQSARIDFPSDEEPARKVYFVSQKDLARLAKWIQKRGFGNLTHCREEVARWHGFTNYDEFVEAHKEAGTWKSHDVRVAEKRAKRYVKERYNVRYNAGG